MKVQKANDAAHVVLDAVMYFPEQKLLLCEKAFDCLFGKLPVGDVFDYYDVIAGGRLFLGLP